MKKKKKYRLHPNYKLEDALSLARDLIYGPLPPPEAPTPPLNDALQAVRDARKRVHFNWLTGEAAEEAIREALGEEYAH